MSRVFFHLLVCALALVSSSAYSQHLWPDAFYGMTVEAFQARYPDAKEVIRQPQVQSLRVTDSAMGGLPADITFVFKNRHLSNVGYHLKIRGAFDAAQKNWDLVLMDFQSWHKPASPPNSRHINSLELRESWETDLRIAVELTMMKGFSPETYEIFGRVQVAPWELMARERLVELAAIATHNAELLTAWKGRPIIEYVKEFGPPDSVMKMSNSETPYIWAGPALTCKTTIHVSNSAKILDRKVMGCSQ